MRFTVPCRTVDLKHIPLGGGGRANRIRSHDGLPGCYAGALSRLDAINALGCETRGQWDHRACVGKLQGGSDKIRTPQTVGQAFREASRDVLTLVVHLSQSQPTFGGSTACP